MSERHDCMRNRVQVGCIRIWIAACCAPLLPIWLAGCASAPADSRGIAAENPAVKIRAIKAAGEQGDVTLAGQLVEQLSDEDPAVRFYAIGALQRIAGDDKGYRYYDKSSDRMQAVERWRSWLKAGEPVTQPAVVEGQ